MACGGLCSFGCADRSVVRILRRGLRLRGRLCGPGKFPQSLSAVCLSADMRSGPLGGGTALALASCSTVE